MVGGGGGDRSAVTSTSALARIRLYELYEGIREDLTARLATRNSPPRLSAIVNRAGGNDPSPSVDAKRDLHLKREIQIIVIFSGRAGEPLF